MRTSVHDPGAPKKATNVSINTDLLRQAKELGINLSQALETRLEELILEKRRASWQQENQEAIENYNRRIESRGTVSDGRRGF